MAVAFPELSTEEEEEEGDDDNGSSDEFTDSIEEEDDKVMTRSLASIQVKFFYLHFTVNSLYIQAICIHRFDSLTEFNFYLVP